MKALFRSLFRVLSFNRKVSYRTAVMIGLSMTIVVTALMIDVTSDAQEMILTKERGSISPRSVDRKTTLSSKSDPKTQKMRNYDIRLSGAEAAVPVIEKSSPGLQKSDIAANALQQSKTIEAGLAGLRKEAPKAEIDLSPLTGAVEIVRSPDGLTSPDHRADGSAIVRDFISENRSLYGLDAGDIADLNFLGESVTPANGLRMVSVEQIVNGRPIFQSESRFILDGDGRIVRSLGSMIPNASGAASSLDGLLSPEEALRLTMEPMGIQLDTSLMKTTPVKRDAYSAQIKTNDPNIGGDVTSKLVYFPIAPGVLAPAYSQVVFGANEDWYVLVDARDGTLLWRKNIRSHQSTHDARFRVYVQADGTTPADSPAPQSPSSAVVGAGTQFPGIAPSIVSMFTAQSLVASPNGWIDDCPGGVCTANETQTLGNNALACLDRVVGVDSNICDTAASSVLDGNGRPIGNPDANGRNRDFLGTGVVPLTGRDFETNFLPPPQAGNPEAGQTATGNGSGGTLPVDQFRRASVVQQFYNTNWYHDKLHALGFNQAARNFQNNNFLGGGAGNDRVLVDVQDATAPGVDNANFSTPPDGGSGRAQMFRFTGPTIDRDGGLDAEVLFHELTHGTSNRIIGNASGLDWDIGAGMGEGWSDFYAMSLLNNTNADNPNGNYASGAYATYKAFGVVSFLDNYVYGIRRFPYSTNNAVNPLTWADVDQATYNQSGGIAVNPLGFEFGGALEVHNVGEIWALTLWEMRSRIIAANAGSVPTGNQISLQVVTDAMKMTPANPSFLQARDAIVAADCATNACANEDSIWNAFADRGLGYGAKVPNSVMFTPVSGHIGVVESVQAPNLDVNTMAVSDTIGNNTGFIDPNEPVLIQVNLRNPWQGASKTATGVTATISSSTPGVSILTPTTTYPNIGPNSNSSASGAALRVRAPAAAACGSRLNFTLMVSSSLGVVARNFSIRLGQPSGTLAPLTYTRSALTIPIPDNLPVGTADTINVPDDFDIADVDVRIDGITHTFPGDLTFSIKGPNGYGTDTLSLLGAVGGGGTNAGQNITNMLFDDAAAGDILLATNAQAPYSGSWKPVFNSPTWPAVGFPAQDPIGQLSNFNSTSSLGVWTARVADEAAVDTGTWNGWSLIITPRNFACTPFTPTATSVSISGRVVAPNGRGLAGATVTLTNSLGISRSVQTNTFGFYQFTDVPALGTYVITPTLKRYRFEPQVVNVNDEITGLNFVGEPSLR